MADQRPGVGTTLWLMGVLGVLFAGAWLLWNQDTRRDTRHPEYSVHRTDDRGAAIAYRLFQDAGLRPEVWNSEFTRLTAPGLLMLIAPARQQRVLNGGEGGGGRGDILPHELEALDRWVRDGNVVVVLSRDANPLYAGLGLIVDEPRGLSGTPTVPTQPSLLARGIVQLQLQAQFGFKYGRQKDQMAELLEVEEPESPIELIPANEWLPLFTKKEGPRTMAQVVTAARGRGLYVAVNDAYPASNLGVTAADNSRFLLNLAALRPAGGKIWFDEYHKRDVERGLIAYLRDRALVPVLVYGILLLGIVFWRTGVRFGAPEPLVADPRRDSAEYIRAVAQLYQNAGVSREALSTIFMDFQRRLAGALRIDGLADLEEVGRRYEQRTGRPAIEARMVLVQTEAALARDRLTEREALEFCEQLTRLDQVLHQPPGDRKG